MSLHIVILAAGQGKRMRSDLPKVLHRLAGRPLLEHVARTAAVLDAAAVHVVYGHGGERVREVLAHLPVEWVEQREQLGTGHAVEQALPRLAEGSTVLVLYGDVPLIRAQTLQGLVEAGRGGLALLTVELADPEGYGRIVRSPEGTVQRIVEHKDASGEELALREVNTGIMAVDGARLAGWLERIDNDNAQGEYYLTDIVELAVREGVPVNTATPADPHEVMGVNDRLQLAGLERHYQRLEADRLMREGVTLADPARLDVRGEVQAGHDVSIDVNVLLEGRVRIGDRVRIGPNVVLRDVNVADDAEILANCLIEEASIGAGARVGPFSRVRPETHLDAGVHVGNFVEIKKATVGEGSKINHLSYVGDTDIGRDVNVGAGTITCNYDGANKHRTVIADGAFIGSDTQLVAPVEVGAGATVGAGTTLVRDAPAGKLTLGRARQQTVEGWKRPTKKSAEDSNPSGDA